MSIIGAVEAMTYQHAPNIAVAYPGPRDWQALYRPKDSAASRHHDMRRHHNKSVFECLNQIFGRAVGRAVFAEIKQKPDFSVMILAPR